MDKSQLHYTKLKAARFKRLRRVGPVTGHSGIHRTAGEIRSGARLRAQGVNCKRVRGDLGEMMKPFCILIVVAIMRLSKLIELHIKRINFTVNKVYLNFKLTFFTKLYVVVFIHPEVKSELHK